MVASDIAADGQKHALGLWEGATENTAVCQSLLANLESRGLRTDRSLLVILDGALALHKAVRAVFARPPSSSGAKSTSSATSSTTCRSASARGSRRLCDGSIRRVT